LCVVKSPALLPTSYTNDLNAFRADLEEANWDSNVSASEAVTNSLTPASSQPFLLNPLKLRTTIKNLIVTHGAIQKVYKSRFDEGRSNMNPSLLFNTYLYYPFLSEKRANYESALSKNKESFFQNNFFHLRSTQDLSTLNASGPLNFTFLDLPFLLSLKSDAARYL
jgi:hypothetical protein